MPSRNEQYLEAAVNKSGTDGLPNPVSRNEKLLHRLVEEMSELPSTNGAAYKQLVTDGNGNTKWEARLAYEGGSRLAVDAGNGVQIVKVSDEIPSWASVDSSMKVWSSNLGLKTASPESYTNLGNGSIIALNSVVIATTENLEFDGVVFPEKGVYFVFISDNSYVTGIASADSDTPEITWDGTISVIKKIDEKFIPDIPAEKLPDIPVPIIEVNGHFISTIENASQPSYTVKNLSYSDILSIFNSKKILIKDSYTYYRPTEFEISTSGNLFVTILVDRVNTSGNLVVASLSCSKGKNTFYRNNYYTIVGTKH